MLDPHNWEEFRALAHRMLDEAIDDVSSVAERPVWQAIPPEVLAEIQSASLPENGRALRDVYADYRRLIAPYTVGNRHPRFLGWVHGSGTPSGMLAQMLMAALNINAGGREHAAVHIERSVVAWWADVFGLPVMTSGIVTSGTSMATLLAVQIARTRALGSEVRETGIGAAPLVAYAARGTHHCVQKAFEVSGIGRAALRLLPTSASGGVDLNALAEQIVRDRAAGLQPFMLVGTAGTVDIGAGDNLNALADCALEQGLWFHVDGAFGALAILAPKRRTTVAGIERADSLAIDFHKWLHVPYGTGLMLTRHAELHRATFADDVPYLARLRHGTAGGDPWFCDYGIELSRGFGALSVWFAMQEFGLAKLGESIEENCRLATLLARRLTAIPHMEIAAPVHLNIVCARYAPPELDDVAIDALNAELVVQLQISGVAVPSTTRIGERLVMRFNLTNHRTRESDLAIIVTALISEIANLREGGRPRSA